MDLHLNQINNDNYHSSTQIARVITESWLGKNMFCPRCGNMHINHFPNNRPVADFYCPECMNEYELKSKNGSVGGKINDGAYFTMINRITSNNNPDFFFMGYSKVEMRVNSLTIIPKHFFVPDIIEKRKPLSENAARAGWVGCNILINKIPKQGVINIVKDGIISDVDDVVDKVNKSYRLEVKDIENRGWLLDILTCVNQMKDSIFTLGQIYEFEDTLAKRHPHNNNIKPKIRQQLQLLRDKGFIEFLGDAHYRRIE